MPTIGELTAGHPSGRVANATAGSTLMEVESAVACLLSNASNVCCDPAPWADAAVKIRCRCLLWSLLIQGRTSASLFPASHLSAEIWVEPWGNQRASAGTGVGSPGGSTRSTSNFSTRRQPCLCSQNSAMVSNTSIPYFQMFT